MELLLQAWIYDKKYFFGFPYLHRQVIELWLIFPALLNIIFMATIYESYIYIKLFFDYCQTQEGSFFDLMNENHKNLKDVRFGFQLIIYYVLVTLSTLCCWMLIIAQKTCKPKMGLIRGKNTKNPRWILDFIYTKSDYYWLRRQFTHTFVGILSLIVFLSLTIWSVQYSGLQDYNFKWNSPVSMGLIEVHAGVLRRCFVIALTSMVATYTFKVLINLFHLQCPKFGQKLFFWKKRDLFSECAELSDQYDFIFFETKKRKHVVDAHN